MLEEINRQLKAHNDTVNMISEHIIDEIVDFARLLINALSDGNKVLVMGNGGSAADAQHFAAELVGRFLMERRALPAIALTTDTSILTAVGNDYGFEDIFKRQVEALAAPGDILLGLSTSGKSTNIIKAFAAGKDIGMRTVGLLGRDGGEVGAMVDLSLIVPSFETPRIQEAQLVVIHILCDLVEKGLFGNTGHAVK